MFNCGVSVAGGVNLYRVGHADHPSPVVGLRAKLKQKGHLSANNIVDERVSVGDNTGMSPLNEQIDMLIAEWQKHYLLPIHFLHYEASRRGEHRQQFANVWWKNGSGPIECTSKIIVVRVQLSFRGLLILMDHDPTCSAVRPG